MPRPYPSDLDDTEWQLIERLLPGRSATGHPRAIELRDIVEAIFYVQREGCTWRALPDDFPAWQTVYGYLRLWQKLGVWQEIPDALRIQLREAVGKQPQASAAVVDSQSVKTTEKGEVYGFDVAKQTQGRKRFALVDTLGLVLSLVVLEASCPERLGGAIVLLEAAEEVKTNLVRLWVDQGFSGQNFARVVGQVSQAEVEVICRKSKDFEVLPKRWIVERTFGWWNRYRRLSKDYELLVEMSEAMIYGAMMHLMLRRLAKLKQNDS